jgi:NAD-dependent deacetylase
MSLDTARTLMDTAERIAILTGAGISAESGIPTFRGAAGLWNNFRAEDLATPQAFRRDPELVWRWYNWRRGLVAKAVPNAGHQALALLESRAPEFYLVTQNVDGLHQQAGNRNVLELHGSLWRLRCTRCGNEWTDRETYTAPPLCVCGAMARPGVVWFGENLPAETWQAAETAVAQCDLLLVIGTSAVVYPAAGLLPFAKSHGARVIEVNLEPTPVSDLVDVSLSGPAGVILPTLVA